MQLFAAEREGAIEKPDQPNGFSKGKGKSEMNVLSEKSGDPMWKLVRKGTAPAFAAQNLRCDATPWHKPCRPLQHQRQWIDSPQVIHSCMSAMLM